MAEDEKVPFIHGAPQSDYNQNKEIKINNNNDNFIWQNFLDSQDFYEYSNDLKLQEFIHETILDSTFKGIYLSRKILSEDGYNIYIYVKEKLIETGDFIFYDTLQLFLNTVLILNMNLNNLIHFISVDEQIELKRELEKKMHIKQKEKRLF